MSAVEITTQGKPPSSFLPSMNSSRVAGFGEILLQPSVISMYEGFAITMIKWQERVSLFFLTLFSVILKIKNKI